MGFKDFTNKIQKAAQDYKEHQVEKKEAEDARQQSILAGQIAPVQVNFNLLPGEQAYLSLSAKRMANVDHVIEKTTGKTKKKGVITRGVVGGVLLGPVGMVAGAATAGSRVNTQTVQETTTKHEVVDSGTLLFTNQRLIFAGNNIMALPYQNILAYSFNGNKMTGFKFAFKYENMLPNEQFVVSGEAAKDAELYYKGITAHLLVQAPESQPPQNTTQADSSVNT